MWLAFSIYYIFREDWKPVLTVNSIVYGLQYLFLVSCQTSIEHCYTIKYGTRITHQMLRIKYKSIYRYHLHSFFVIFPPQFLKDCMTEFFFFCQKDRSPVLPHARSPILSWWDPNISHFKIYMFQDTIYKQNSPRYPFTDINEYIFLLKFVYLWDFEWGWYKYLL